MDLIPAVIILGAGESQLPLIKQAKKMNYVVFAIDKNPKSIGFIHSDFIINESTLNTKKIILALKKFEKKYEFKGILARTSGKPLLTASAISEEFHLPGLSKNLVNIAISKSKFREFCKSHQISFPEGRKIILGESCEKNFFPAIMKPDLSNMGKIHIFYCSDNLDVQKNLQFVSKTSSNSFVEIESFIDGIDVACACWAFNGKMNILAWWDELVGISHDNQIMGIGVSIPSVINQTQVKGKIELIVQKIVTLFSELNTIILISFRISMKGKPYVIELHLDLGGDLIADKLLPSANPKFNYFEIAIKIATNTMKHFPPVNFNPTLMCYLSKTSKIKKTTISRYSNNLIFQNDSIQKNLQELKNNKTIYETNLKFFPKHEDWFLRNN